MGMRKLPGKSLNNQKTSTKYAELALVFSSSRISTFSIARLLKRDSCLSFVFQKSFRGKTQQISKVKASKLIFYEARSRSLSTILQNVCVD
jgi:hypothetical protein